MPYRTERRAWTKGASASAMTGAYVRTHRVASRRLGFWSALGIACLTLVGCSAHGSQSAPSPTPIRPTLTQLIPNKASVGSAGILTLRGANFVPGASSVASPSPGLTFRNIRVNSPEQITADYANSPDSPLGYFRVTVTTPGGTSEPAIFTIIPLAYQFGVALPLPRPSSPAVFGSLQVGIHADQVENPDGSLTDAYLRISFTDARGRPVKVGDSTYSDMDNVDAPDDDTDESGARHVDVTSYSFAVEKPDPGEYILQIKSSRKGSFVLELAAETPSSQGGLTYNPFAELQNVPALPGITFALRFVCHGDPRNMDIASGGLRPPNGAFSFAQPTTAHVQLPPGEKTLPVVLYYDPAVEVSSFRALLDGNDLSRMFHVRSGELELVAVPLEPGQRTLTIRASNKRGQVTEQEFHIQH